MDSVCPIPSIANNDDDDYSFNFATFHLNLQQAKKDMRCVRQFHWNFQRPTPEERRMYEWVIDRMIHERNETRKSNSLVSFLPFVFFFYSFYFDC